jgi:ATP-dependent 26S proteasome regulatory subunit
MSHVSDEDRELLNRLFALGEGAPSLEQKVALIQQYRRTRERSRQVDQLLLEHVLRFRQGLEEVQQSQGELRSLLESLLEPPWFPSILVRTVTTEAGPRALVMYGGTHRVVAVSDELDFQSLIAGEEVYLGKELNAVVARSPDGMPRSGETACFDRHTADGRLVLKWRDEEVVVSPAGSLQSDLLRPGDQVRWDRLVWLAFEKLERQTGTHWFLEETPAERFENIGGLDEQLRKIKRCIGLHRHHAATADRYRHRPTRAILFVGPPGGGKTMTARAFCNWLAQQSRSGRARFMNVKPAALHSMWYSQSEANYREAFRIAREAAKAEPDIPVVMFFDEVDAIGAARGDSLMRVDDRVLNAFMTELDGLEERGNVLLRDLVIEFPRPNMNAAREIFAKHFPADIPYAADGYGGDATERRQHIIDTAVSQLYTPNGNGDLATLVFRDGSRQTVKAADVISGAHISQIAQSAIAEACMREVETSHVGVRLDDVLSATAEQCTAAARVLTPINCRRYLSSLPDDVDVVSVQPVEKKVAHPHRYLHLQAA